MTSWLAALRDRPIPDGQRHAALAASSLLLIAVTVLFALTRITPHAPGRTAPRRTSTAAAASRPAPNGAPSHEAEAVGRAFLAGYLAYTYGAAPAAGIADTTPALTRALEAHPPRQTPGMRASRPRILELHAAPAGPGVVSVRALVNDGGLIDYTVGLLLQSHDGRLLVTAVEED